MSDMDIARDSALPRSAYTARGDSPVSEEDEKKMDLVPTIIPVSETHAKEYTEYLGLKTKYDNDPAALKKLVRKRKFLKNSQWRRPCMI